jgi:rhodanese-related sulfurtransferase
MRLLLLIFSLLSFAVNVHATDKLSLGELQGLPKHNSKIGWQLVEQGGVLIDVRTPSEYQAEKIDQAQNIPLQVLQSRVTELDKSKAIVVYCRSGNRSGVAATFLRQQGFNVYDAGTYTLMSQ